MLRCSVLDAGSAPGNNLIRSLRGRRSPTLFVGVGAHAERFVLKKSAGRSKITSIPPSTHRGFRGRAGAE